MTPWLAESRSGFTTQGNTTRGRTDSTVSLT
jgi:hypothetical protein